MEANNNTPESTIELGEDCSGNIDQQMASNANVDSKTLKVRNFIGLSRPEMASMMGVSDMTIGNLERGKVRETDQVLSHLSFIMSFFEVFDGEFRKDIALKVISGASPSIKMSTLTTTL